MNLVRIVGLVRDLHQLSPREIVRGWREGWLEREREDGGWGSFGRLLLTWHVIYYANKHRSSLSSVVSWSRMSKDREGEKKRKRRRRLT